MTEWFAQWFNEDYLELYPHRDEAEADRLARLVAAATGLAPGWRVLDVACGAGRHARAFAALGARCTGVDLSATLLGRARAAGTAALVRADLRRLPVRPGSMDLTVNLFTSFGYFADDAEHQAALGEMVGTVRPGGWFALDFLNADSVRAVVQAGEAPQPAGTGRHRVQRALSPDGRHVEKVITTDDGRRFLERVRLFPPAELEAMLGAAGLAVHARYGDYAGDALHPGSPRVILVGRRG